MLGKLFPVLYASEPLLLFEQLEERIVLDGAIDDVSSRTDLFSSQAVDQLDSGDFAGDAAGAEAGLEAPSLAVETGSETLPDGTWHYWERDEWTTDSNGYEFHAWQDGSTSFHQVQWDAAANSKGTHNGFDYNLQRDGSYTYQAVQWDANQDGYSYDSTSTGIFHYEAHQWANGLGYDYSSDNTGNWYYHVVLAGEASGDTASYSADSAGFWHYEYNWANGQSWKDGPKDQPYLVKDIRPDGSGLTENDEDFTNVNGTLYFRGNDGTHGTELWKSDGTAAGTMMVKDIYPGSDTSNPWYLTNVNGTLYFRADDGTHGTELWKSDGTEAGTVMVKEICAETDDTWWTDGSSPSWLTDVNGTLYFSAYDSTHGTELWKSDGTASGTVMLKDIVNGNKDGAARAHDLVNVNGTLYYAGQSDYYDYDLWKSNGTEASTVEVNVVSPYNLTNVNGTLYFTAYEDTHGTELWKSDGTEAGTVMVKDINPGKDGWPNDYTFYSGYTGIENAANLTEVNGTLYFPADDGTHGRELWKSDGTEAGTVMVKDINPGSAGTKAALFTNVNGTLYFVADDGTHGWELWKSDGTETGTVMVKDIVPDKNTQNSADYLTDVNGTLYFRVWEGQSLWKSDGTSAGTHAISGYGTDLINVNGTVFYMGSGELWAILT